MKYSSFSRLAVFAAVAALTACASGTLAPPSAEQGRIRDNLRQQWQGFFDKEDRLWDVAWKLREANAPLCRGIRRMGGWSHLSAKEYKAASRARVWRHPLPSSGTSFSEREVVQSVASGSPSDKAGLRPGDVYLVLDHDDAREWRLEVLRSTSADTLALDGVAQVDTLVVHPVSVCDVVVGISKDPSVNAWTDGRNIGVTEGMVDYVQNDDELAFVIGHELAHVALDHIGKKKSNSLWRGLLGLTIDGLAGCRYCDTGGRLAEAGAKAYSVEFETEADYAGAYMAARAGYDPTLAGPFFARMVASSSTPTVWGTSHPVDAARELNAALYAAEISEKRASGVSDDQLRPNKR